MPRLRRLTADQGGSASLEFLTAGMILLLPIVYLVLVMAAVQAGALAVEGAARQAARVFVQADDERSARERADRAIRFALADHGLDENAVDVSVTCSPEPRDCLNRLGTVTFTIGIAIPLPLMPAAIASARLSAPVQATATQRVSRFWGAR
jgi:uncharacterized membrane protein